MIGPIGETTFNKIKISRLIFSKQCTAIGLCIHHDQLMQTTTNSYDVNKRILVIRKKMSKKMLIWSIVLGQTCMSI